VRCAKQEVRRSSTSGNRKVLGSVLRGRRRELSGRIRESDSSATQAPSSETVAWLARLSFTTSVTHVDHTDQAGSTFSVE
jgi:hypothetical protein